MEQIREKTLTRVTLLWIPISILLFLVLILSGIFMRSVQSNLFQNRQDYFYSVMTLHGIGMAGLWYVAPMAGILYLSRLYVKPAVGVQYFALMCTLIGIFMLIASTLAGKFAAGWYFLYPLPFHGTWAAWATHCFLGAVLILGGGWLVWNLDYLRAVARKYSLGHALGWHYFRGKAEPEVPPFILITTVSCLLCLVALFSAVAVLVFYYLEIISGIQNDALLMKNLTFFFGHLLVNLSMYLGVAMVYEVLPRYAHRSWKNNMLISLAWNFVLIAVLFAYFHHLYMDFVQPRWMQFAGQIASYLSSIPAAVMSIFGTLALVYRANMKWDLTSIFLFLGVMGWAIGGVGAVIDSTVAVNERFHNTLWVPAHFHTYTLMGLTMMVLGYYYHILHSLTGAEQKNSLARFITILYLAGGYGLVAVFYISGAASIPRRYAIYHWDILASGPVYAKIALGFALLIFIGVLLYFYELFRRWLKALKMS